MSGLLGHNIKDTVPASQCPWYKVGRSVISCIECQISAHSIESLQELQSNALL
jgi:hypothetical protein